MPMTLFAYFNAMEAAIQNLPNEAIADEDQKIQDTFLALCDQGRKIEESVFFALPKKTKLVADTKNLFLLLGLPTEEYYRLDTPRRIALAQIYCNESYKLAKGEYTFNASTKIIYAMNKDEKAELEANLQKIERSLAHYQQGADHRSNLQTSSSEDPVSESDDFAEVPVCQSAEIFGDPAAQTLMIFMALYHGEHARRARVLYVALVECLAKRDKATMQTLINRQLALHTLQRPRSGWCRLRHFWHWNATNQQTRLNTLDTAWRTKSPNDTFHSNLTALKFALGS